jgi:hypothetical protein
MPIAIRYYLYPKLKKKALFMANRGSVDGREALSAAEEESQAFSTPLATFDIPPRGPTFSIRTALKATIAGAGTVGMGPYGLPPTL